MSAPPAVKLMTTEELLAMPDDGVERYLVDGHLREVNEEPMTYRNRWHCGAESEIGYHLNYWLKQRPKPRGKVYSGEVGCRLHRDPDTIMGIDLVYVSADMAVQESAETTLIDGVPILAVEILSPQTKVEKILEKVKTFLKAGVALVWLVDPYFHTVTVHRPDAPPKMYNTEDELTAEPHLPGFRVRVAELFEN